MANGEPIESSIYGCVSDASALTPQLEIKCFWSVHFLKMYNNIYKNLDQGIYMLENMNLK